MPDSTDLEALIARLAKIDYAQGSEQATREMAVNPVIGALGWDTFNPDEVAREYSVRGGRVDYCLRGQGRNLVLIEVKRVGSGLDEHQEQLLRYAFDEGVPLAALTDGRVWWLYLPRADAKWEQRKFFSLDISSEDAEEAAAALHRFLNRDDSVSGAALEEAQRDFESQERDRRVRAALQEAWQRVLSNPQGLLRDLLAEEVKEVSGHDPDRETVAAFLREVAGRRSTEAELPAPSQIGESGDARTPGQSAAATRRSRLREQLSPETHEWEYVRAGRSSEGIRSVSGARLKGYHVLRDRRTGSEVVVGRSQMTYTGVQVPPSSGLEQTPEAGRRTRTPSVHPAAFWLDGARYEVKSWRRILPRLCEELANEVGPEAFSERVAQLRGRRRPYFSSSAVELKVALQIPGVGLYVEGRVNAVKSERIARLTLHGVRGSDDSFRIELAE